MSPPNAAPVVPPVRFILLAPTSVVGGITTWTRFLLGAYDRRRLEPLHIDSSKKYEEIGKERNLRGTLLGVLHALGILGRIVWLVGRRRPRLLYTTCSGFWSFFTRDLAYVVLARIVGVKIILHLVAGNIESYFGHSALTRWLARRVMGGATRLVVVNRAMEQRARQHYAAKTLYLPNMIGEEIFSHVRPSPRAPGPGLRVLHMAFQSPMKGSYDILDAFRLLRGRHPGLVCDLVGRAAPEHEAVIRQRIAEFGLQDRVHLHPEASGEVKWQFFNEADIFLFPSHTEGFPMVILEAMCFGLPILATPVGNIAEMIGIDTAEPAGLLLRGVNPVSAEELAEQLTRLVEDPALRARLAASGPRRVRENYVAGIVVPHIEDLIVQTATGR